MHRVLKKWIYTIPLVAVVGACSATMPVTGQLIDGSEIFTGSAETGMTMDAPFTMTSSQGTTCTGAFDIKSLGGGTGMFSCTDGRTGSFDWATRGGKFVGTGTIGGAPMTITMG